MAYNARTLALHLLTLGLAAAGCAQVIGIDHEYVDDDKETTTSTSAGGGSSASTGSLTSTTTSTTSTTASTTTSSSAASSSGQPLTCPADYECVPSVASGSYVRVTADPDACPTGWVGAGVATDGKDPGCAACSCDPGVGGTCGTISVHRWSDMACTTAVDSFTPAAGACVALPAPANAYLIGTPTITGGACQPKGGNALPVTSGTLCMLEAPQLTGCADNGQCVPVGSQSSTGVCNVIAMADACAAGWVDKGIIYSSYNDTRTCGCTCTGNGSCVGASVDLYSSNDACKDNPDISIPAGTACKDTAAVGELSFRYNSGTWTPGQCMASAMVGGKVTFSDPKRLCCLP